jgi:hypothetical protein
VADAVGADVDTDVGVGAIVGASEGDADGIDVSPAVGSVLFPKVGGASVGESVD